MLTDIRDTTYSLQKTKFSAPSRKGRMGIWHNEANPPRVDHRHCGIQVLCSPYKAGRTPKHGKYTTSYCPTKKPMGARECAVLILWPCHLTINTLPASEILHQKSLRRSKSRCTPAWKSSKTVRQIIACRPQRLTVLVNDVGRGRPSNWRRETGMVPSHRRRRREVRSNSRPEYDSRLRGRYNSTRNMVPIPSAQINHTAGVDCTDVCPRGCFGSSNSVGRHLPPPDTHRQHGSVPHHLQYGFVQSGVNDRAPSPSPALSPDESYYPSVMAPLSSEQTR